MLDRSWEVEQQHYYSLLAIMIHDPKPGGESLQLVSQPFILEIVIDIMPLELLPVLTHTRSSLDALVVRQCRELTGETHP